MITITAVPFLLPQLNRQDVSSTTTITTAKVPLLASLPALSPRRPFLSLLRLPSQPDVSYMAIITTVRGLQRLSCPLLCFPDLPPRPRRPPYLLSIRRSLRPSLRQPGEFLTGPDKPFQLIFSVTVSADAAESTPNSANFSKLSFVGLLVGLVGSGCMVMGAGLV
jgi:hypothetical protein